MQFVPPGMVRARPSCELPAPWALTTCFDDLLHTVRWLCSQNGRNPHAMHGGQHYPPAALRFVPSKRAPFYLVHSFPITAGPNATPGLRYDLYNSQLRADGALDFDDLLHFTVALLTHRPQASCISSAQGLCNGTWAPFIINVDLRQGNTPLCPSPCPRLGLCLLLVFESPPLAAYGACE